jgi:hypothetical protein
MALFKVFRGQRSDLDSVAKVDGHAYFCTDDGSFHIDYKVENGEVQRKELNAANAKTLTGKTLNEIETEFQNSLQISGTVTKDIGGIKKDTVYENAKVIDVLEELLFPYVPFTFNSISTTASAGTKEYGTSVTVTKVTPSFAKGSKNITSVKIGTTSGGNDLYSGTSASNGSAITLTTSKSYNGITGGTIYCTLSDGTTTTTKSTAVSYAYYTYYAVTDTTDAPTSWTAVGSTSVTDISITANKGQYVWIASPNSYSGICELNELSGKYNSAAATVKTSSQSLTNSKNYACTNKYYFYRLQDPRAGSGTSKFKLA